MLPPLFSRFSVASTNVELVYLFKKEVPNNGPKVLVAADPRDRHVHGTECHERDESEGRAEDAAITRCDRRYSRLQNIGAGPHKFVWAAEGCGWTPDPPVGGQDEKPRKSSY